MNNLRKITVSASLLAYAVIINSLFSFIIPIAGVNIMEIKFGNPFIRFAALLFGGVYGGIVGALEDLIRSFVKPLGPYMPALTVVEFFKGLFIGVLWFKLKDVNVKIFNAIYISFVSLCAAAGGATLAANLTAPNSAYITFLSGYAKSADITAASAGLLAAGIVGLAALAPALFLVKKEFGVFLKILVATGIPCLIFSTVNTVMFRYIYFYSQKTFLIYWTPRISKEIIQVIVNAYILLAFLRVYEMVYEKRQIKRG